MAVVIKVLVTGRHCDARPRTLTPDLPDSGHDPDTPETRHGVILNPERPVALSVSASEDTGARSVTRVGRGLRLSPAVNAAGGGSAARPAGGAGVPGTAAGAGGAVLVPVVVGRGGRLTCVGSGGHARLAVMWGRAAGCRCCPGAVDRGDRWGRSRREATTSRRVWMIWVVLSSVRCSRSQARADTTVTASAPPASASSPGVDAPV